jgi:hypothetical protein
MIDAAGLTASFPAALGHRLWSVWLSPALLVIAAALALLQQQKRESPVCMEQVAHNPDVPLQIDPGRTVLRNRLRGQVGPPDVRDAVGQC